MSIATEQALDGKVDTPIGEPSGNLMTLEGGQAYSFDEISDVNGEGEEQGQNAAQEQGRGEGDANKQAGGGESDEGEASREALGTGETHQAQELGEGQKPEEAQKSDEKQTGQEEAKTFTIKAAGQEYEATEPELIQLAQQGIDYTRKTQEVARGKKELEQKVLALAPLEQLAMRLNNDPKFREHVLLYDIPEDPMERMQFEASQKAAAELKEAYGPIVDGQQRQLEEVKQAIAIEKAVAHYSKDELYPDTVRLMQEDLREQFMAGQISAQQHDQILQRLDSDPDFFGQSYGHFRAKAEQAQKSQAKPSESAVGKKVSVERKAPFVEAGKGNAVNETITARERTKQLLQGALDGDDKSIGALFS